MITKAKRKSRLIKKFTKGAIRLSTANGSNIKKNGVSIFKGIHHCLCRGEVFKELKIDVMQFMSNNSRMSNIIKREEFAKEHYGEEYTYKQVISSIKRQRKNLERQNAKLRKEV